MALVDRSSSSYKYLFSTKSSGYVNIHMEELDPRLRPRTITLPDGRSFSVKTLLNQVRNRQSINLRTRRETATVPRNRLKYTVEERRWQSQADLEDIARRYNISLKRAQGMRYTAKYIIEALDNLE